MLSRPSVSQIYRSAKLAMHDILDDPIIYHIYKTSLMNRLPDSKRLTGRESSCLPTKRRRLLTGNERYLEELIKELNECSTLVLPLLMIIARYVLGEILIGRVMHHLRVEKMGCLTTDSSNHSIPFAIDTPIIDIVKRFLTIPHRFKGGDYLTFDESIRINILHNNKYLDTTMLLGELLYDCGVKWDRIKGHKSSLWLVATLPKKACIDKDSIKEITYSLPFANGRRPEWHEVM